MTLKSIYQVWIIYSHFAGYSDYFQTHFRSSGKKCIMNEMLEMPIIQKCFVCGCALSNFHQCNVKDEDGVVWPNSEACHFQGLMAKHFNETFVRLTETMSRISRLLIGIKLLMPKLLWVRCVTLNSSQEFRIVFCWYSLWWSQSSWQNMGNWFRSGLQTSIQWGPMGWDKLVGRYSGWYLWRPYLITVSK